MADEVPYHTLFFAGDRWACLQDKNVWSAFKNKMRPTKKTGVWKNRPSIASRSSRFLDPTIKPKRTADGRWTFAAKGRCFVSVEDEVVLTGVEASPATNAAADEPAPKKLSLPDKAALAKAIEEDINQLTDDANFYVSKDSAVEEAIRSYNILVGRGCHSEGVGLRRYVQKFEHDGAVFKDRLVPAKLAHTMVQEMRSIGAGVKMFYSINFGDGGVSQLEAWIV